MKRSGGLFTKIVALENIRLAHKKAKKGKAHYVEVQQIEKSPDIYLLGIQDLLIQKTFKTAKYQTKTIFEPKKRTIYKLPYFPDRIVHHAIMNVMQPIWDKVFIYDLYSAIPGKGLHRGVERLHRFMKDKENSAYCLKFDIKNFYPSVNQDILYELITRKIKCKDTLWLLEDVIHSPKGKTNLPIGNYLSQYFSNIYLNWFDHWLKEEKGMRYYIRYCDDGVILLKSKEGLNILLTEIVRYFRDELELELNPKTQIFPVAKRGIDFLGYRSFRNYTLLRKSSAERFKTKIKFIEQYHHNMEPKHIVSSIMSYSGWIKHANGHNLLKKYITGNPKISEILAESERACKRQHVK
jgi:retron-type reverse transcriptase